MVRVGYAFVDTGTVALAFSERMARPASETGATRYGRAQSVRSRGTPLTPKED